MRLKTTFSRATRTATAAFAVALTSGLPANNNFTPAAQAQTAATIKLPAQMAIGECTSRANFIAGLQAEGQTPLVVTEVTTLRAVDATWQSRKETFTGSADLSKGYEFEQRINGEYCKVANIFNIKLLRGLNGNIDTAAYAPNGGYEEGTLNYAINRAHKTLGAVPMLQANARALNNSKQYLTVTVIGKHGFQNHDANIFTGAILISMPQSGDITADDTVKTANYTPTAVTTLSKPAQTAAPK